jgi:monoterpene epsilon-lactone hydrolase
MARMLWLFVSSVFTTIAHRMRHGPARPSWTLTFECIVSLLRRDWETSRRWSFQRLRADLDARPYHRSFVRQVVRVPETIGGVPGEWFVPEGAPQDQALLFLHGGSYIVGSTRTHADIIARLAIATGVRAFAANYRLAPEHPYPAALDDALAVLDGMARTIRPERIVVIGDSAGGNLALVLQLTRRDRGLPQAAALALISPWLDLTASRPSCRANDAVDYGSSEMLLGHAQAFAGPVALDDPRVSPIGARLEGLAPIFLQVGDAERLRDEGIELANRARAAGVHVTLDVLRDMPHNGPILAAYHAEGARGLANIAAFGSRHLAGGARAD